MNIIRLTNGGAIEHCNENVKQNSDDGARCCAHQDSLFHLGRQNAVLLILNKHNDPLPPGFLRHQTENLAVSRSVQVNHFTEVNKRDKQRTTRTRDAD